MLSILPELNGGPRIAYRGNLNTGIRKCGNRPEESRLLQGRSAAVAFSELARPESTMPSVTFPQGKADFRRSQKGGMYSDNALRLRS